MFDDGYRTQVILVLPSEVESEKYKGGNISNPTLLIKNLTKKDEGLYKCSATNMFGTGENNFTRLFVQGNTPISNIPRLEYTGELKSFIIVGCIITSPDAALTSVSWTFDNGSTTPIVINIPPHDNNGKYQGGNVTDPSLHIRNLTKSDEGR
ncbi:unnamed protein product [Mytilus edulis]|uniref:Immunoglobulin I-set domain-containing protein n=1 Tax=Mytilus edulis TaxID=6550 RepID=A0A8S3TFJ1_MYTED|nr:unnamed protein product [Mytilus edulis]